MTTVSRGPIRRLKILPCFLLISRRDRPGLAPRPRIRFQNLPPGPWSLPLLGAYLHLGSDPTSFLLKNRQKYGKIFSLYLGSRLTVVITDPELAREAYSKKGEITGARDISTLNWLDVSGSVVYMSGSDIKPLRRLVQRSLRDFVLGKKGAETIMVKEAEHLCHFLEESIEKNKVLDPRLGIQKASINIMYAFCFGQRFDYASPEMNKVALGLSAVSHISCVSITREIPFLFVAPRFKDFRRGGLAYRQAMHNMVAQHVATLDSCHSRDLTDKLIQATSKDDSQFSFGSDRIFRTLMDLLGAGADTTSSTLQFAIWNMAANPTVQEKVHSEILEVVDNDRTPEWADRHRLPYTCAVINETLRHMHPVPLGLFHRATQTFELGGYTIPEGAELLAPIACMNMDPEAWPDPEEFKPERFLSPDGKTVVLPDKFMPFSTGSRMCIGEGLARMEMFVFFTTMMQRFTFDLPSEALQSCEPETGFFFRYPSQMQICASKNS
ncbi:cytochrome P450 2A10-like isoform X2 [Acanthaster planci]|uniref:Cytochrome P450 2A10-like isoform X2 n=1 Tax=Acanthaster planci TaxID=133434 RepID=A0A8B7YRG5_ACAPL|nr:cytochrome P450 2A10-like isoform X2 [Acanthaster planci]